MESRADLDAIPKPIGIGAEMEALRTFCPDAVTWTGTIHEGGMGPGTPRMTGAGRGKARPIQGGRWLAGDYQQDQFLEDGTFVLTWELHWVMGWSPQHGAYRAIMTDNYGNADVYEGRIEGARLIFESPAGAAVRLRFTWVAPEDGVIVWRNEMDAGDGSWFLIEEYPMVVS
ncbi:MAG TPA: DUF1579 family protein [Actinomycetota bacterium]|nr:DUF1579 family protein [Actinomycetota bacterium]